MLTFVDGMTLVDKLVSELRTGHARTVGWLAEVSRRVPAFTLQYADCRAAAERLEQELNRL